MFPNKIPIVSKAPATGFSNTQSMALDGVDDYLSVADNSAIDLTANMTISVWLYMNDMNDAGAGSDQEIFIKSSAYRAFWITSSGRKIRFRVYPNDNSTIDTDAISEAGSDAWVHFAFTYKKVGTNSDEMRIYQNGSEIKNTTSANTGDMTSNSNPLTIGGSTTGDFKGKMDEFAIWNEVLDADAISAVYNSGVPFDLTEDKGNYDEYTDGLVGYFRFEGDFSDSSDTGLTGTATNDASIATASP